jgi:methionyl-tRNA formyltransferase
MLLSKETLFCKYAIKILESYYQKSEIHVVTGTDGSQLDDELHNYQPEYLISFLSPWIIPGSLLAIAQKAAINFHPGCPRYPGSGCYNFAIYEKAKRYGVTCHHMKEKVDTGNIILTSHFDISPYETVESLKLKSMNHLLMIFERIINSIYTSDSLPVSDEKWLCVPYTKKQLKELCRIDPASMDNQEMLLRIRAADYCSRYDGAYFEIDGKKLTHKSAIEEPIV